MTTMYRAITTAAPDALTVQRMWNLMNASVMFVAYKWHQENPGGDVAAFIARTQSNLQDAIDGKPVRESTARMVADAMRVAGARAMCVEA